MAAINKVVTVEEADEQSGHELSLVPALDSVVQDEDSVFSTPTKFKKRCTAVHTKLNSLIVTRIYYDDIKSAQALEDLERQDKVPPLPDNWPKIPAIYERRSWDFSTAISPSVNKAAAHLELLQGIIEEWFKYNESHNESRRSSLKTNQSRPTTGLSQASTVKSLPMSKRQLRFAGSASIATIEDTSRELSVVGIGTEENETEYELPFLGAEEVIEEVISLLAKMENDRQEMLAALKVQRSKFKQLKLQINEYCKSRLWDMPVAVQAEHEACANDLSELNWHVGSQGNKLEVMTRAHDKAKTLNTRLKADILFIKQHIPLVQEKLELEREAMSRIEQAQLDTSDEYSIASRRCAKVQGKSDEAHRKATEERAAIRQDLDNVRCDLARITEELSVSKMNYNAYVHTANDYRQQIQDNEQEVAVLVVKSVNAIAAETLQSKKVKDIRKKLKEAEYKQKGLETENDELEEIKEWKKTRHEAAVGEMQESIEWKEESLRKVKRNNKEVDMDLEDLGFKINECDRQKMTDDKNIGRMIKELDRTEQLFDSTMEEISQHHIINHASHDMLETEEERTLANEEALRATADALKRQVKEEIHARQLIKSRMTADKEIHEKFSHETSGKKVKTEKMANDVEAAVKVVNKKLDKLRNAERERAKMKKVLEKEFDKLMEQISHIFDMTVERRDKLLPAFQILKDEFAELDNKLKEMNWKQAMMLKKMEEMAASEKMFVKNIRKSFHSIEKLDFELDEFNIRLVEAHKFDETLVNQLDILKTRLRTSDKQHREHIQARLSVQRDLEQSLEEQLALNTVLASSYRKETFNYFFLRHQFLNIYGNAIYSENGIKDIKQLQGLQHKMHAALAIYYKYRGLYNHNELIRMSNQANKNGMRVGTLQTDMDNALDKIADFLQNQLEGDNIRRLAMDRVLRMEAGEVLDDVASVVTASRPNTRLSTAMGSFTMV